MRSSTAKQVWALTIRWKFGVQSKAVVRLWDKGAPEPATIIEQPSFELKWGSVLVMLRLQAKWQCSYLGAPVGVSRAERLHRHDINIAHRVCFV